MLTESAMMVPETRQRFEAALGELKAYLVSVSGTPLECCNKDGRQISYMAHKTCYCVAKESAVRVESRGQEHADELQSCQAGHGTPLWQLVLCTVHYEDLVVVLVPTFCVYKPFLGRT